MHQIDSERKSNKESKENLDPITYRSKGQNLNEN